MDLEKTRAKFLPMSETMFYILLALTEEKHGYGIMQQVGKLTAGRIRLGAGTVYQTLGKLEKGGLIRPTVEVDRKKQYAITQTGRTLLEEEIARLAEMARHAQEVLG